MKKYLLISLTILLLHSGSNAQTAIPIPCSTINYSTSKMALSGDLAGFNNASRSWQFPVNYNTGNQDPNNQSSLADNNIDNRLSTIIKNEMGEIIYRNSGGEAEFFNFYYKGWGNSNPKRKLTLGPIVWCGGDNFNLYGANNAPYDINDPYNNAVSDKFWRANPTKRNTIYSSYPMYNTTAILYPESKDNQLYPMINIIKSTTNNKVANYVINIDAHYKNQRSYLDCNNVTIDKSMRSDLFNKTTQLWTINTLADLTTNNFGTAFKEQVKQNVDAILTMMLNGIDVKYVELGNEHGRVYGSTSEWFNKSKNDVAYGAADIATMYSNFANLPEIPNNSGGTDAVWGSSDLQKFFTPTDVATFNVLSQTGSFTQKSLDVYGALCHMYINVIKNAIGAETGNNGLDISSKQNTIKFGISLDDNYDETNDPFTAAYLNYLFTHQDITNAIGKIGFTGFIIHPYLNLSTTPMQTTAPTTSNTSNLDAYFKELRDKSAAFVNSKYRKKAATISNDPYYKRGTVSYTNSFYNKLPSNGEIWLTEWNAQTNANTISNTLLDAMFYMDTHIAMQDINSGINMISPYAPKNNLCQLANYHLLFGQSNNGNASPGDPVLGISYSSDGSNGVSRTAVFYAHKILKPLFTIKPDYITKTNGGFSSPNTNINFRTYIKENVAEGYIYPYRVCDINLACYNRYRCFVDKDIYVYFNNKTDSSFTIDLSNGSNGVLNGLTGEVQNVQLNRMYGTKLSASRGITTFRTDPTITTNAAITIQLQDINYIKSDYYTLTNTVKPAMKAFAIAPYSMGYIRITVRDYVSVSATPCSYASRLSDFNKDETDKSTSTSIYPNPTTGLVNLNVQINEPVDKYTIEVFSVDGRVALSEIHNEKLDANSYLNKIINISNQPNGVYFIRVISDKNVLLNNKVLLNK